MKLCSEFWRKMLFILWSLVLVHLKYSGSFPLNAPDYPVNICNMFVRTDPSLWKHVSEERNTDEPAKIIAIIEEIVYSHISYANRVFAATEIFSLTGEVHPRLHLKLQKLKIDGYYDGCESRNEFCNDFGNSSDSLLEAFSNSVMEFSEDFCLMHIFTNRELMGRTIGLSQMAQRHVTDTLSVGVCGAPGGNVGLTKFSSYNWDSHDTFVHEIGHSLGADHDSEYCFPRGSFMEASGQVSNRAFSNCAKKSMGRVFDKLLYELSLEQNCLKSQSDSFCGNGILEAGEDCDCGYFESDCYDSRCHSKRDSKLMANPYACQFTEVSELTLNEAIYDVSEDKPKETDYDGSKVTPNGNGLDGSDVTPNATDYDESKVTPNASDYHGAIVTSNENGYEGNEVKPAEFGYERIPSIGANIICNLQILMYEILIFVLFRISLY